MKNWLMLMAAMLGAALLISIAITSVYSLFLWDHKFLAMCDIAFWLVIFYMIIKGVKEGMSK